jgi:polysaccharide deacetylase family protein (PEP-CTERM system associated)
MPDAPRVPFRLSESCVVELPITTISVLGYNLPCGGGGYFRLFPYALSRWALRRYMREQTRPSIFYFHPWELDDRQPRVPGVGLRTRVRHYLNLSLTAGRLRRLLTDFQWDRVDKVFDAAIQ